MKLTQALLFISGVTILSGCIVVANPSYANYHSQQELIIDAKKLSALDIEAGAGSLVIEGSEDVTEITVVADIFTEGRDTNDVELTLTQSRNSAYLVSKIDSNGFWQGDSPHIDIKVIMPSQLMLKIDDGSGAISVSHIYAEVEIKDGSGEMTINDIKSHLKINDGSGGIYISQVTGNVSIIDGSGEIEVTSVGGNLDIDDGSGSIFVKDVSGNAVFEDGSGELMVRNIEGLVTIDDGSGSIDVEQAGGLKIINSGSGGMRVKKVKGGFEIDN